MQYNDTWTQLQPYANAAYGSRWLAKCVRFQHGKGNSRSIQDAELDLYTTNTRCYFCWMSQ